MGAAEQPPIEVPAPPPQAEGPQCQEDWRMTCEPSEVIAGAVRHCAVPAFRRTVQGLRPGVCSHRIVGMSGDEGPAYVADDTSPVCVKVREENSAAITPPPGGALGEYL